MKIDWDDVPSAEITNEKASGVNQKPHKKSNFVLNWSSFLYSRKKDKLPLPKSVPHIIKLQEESVNGNYETQFENNTINNNSHKQFVVGDNLTDLARKQCISEKIQCVPNRNLILRSTPKVPAPDLKIRERFLIQKDQLGYSANNKDIHKNCTFLSLKKDNSYQNNRDQKSVDPLQQKFNNYQNNSNWKSIDLPQHKGNSYQYSCNQIVAPTHLKANSYWKSQKSLDSSQLKDNTYKKASAEYVNISISHTIKKCEKSDVNDEEFDFYVNESDNSDHIQINICNLLRLSNGEQDSKTNKLKSANPVLDEQSVEKKEDTRSRTEINICKLRRKASRSKKVEKQKPRKHLLFKKETDDVCVKQVNKHTRRQNCDFGEELSQFSSTNNNKINRVFDQTKNISRSDTFPGDKDNSKTRLIEKPVDDVLLNTFLKNKNKTVEVDLNPVYRCPSKANNKQTNSREKQQTERSKKADKIVEKSLIKILKSSAPTKNVLEKLIDSSISNLLNNSSQNTTDVEQRNLKETWWIYNNSIVYHDELNPFRGKDIELGKRKSKVSFHLYKESKSTGIKDKSKRYGTDLHVKSDEQISPVFKKVKKLVKNCSEFVLKSDKCTIEQNSSKKYGSVLLSIKKLNKKKIRSASENCPDINKDFDNSFGDCLLKQSLYFCADSKLPVREMAKRNEDLQDETYNSKSNLTGNKSKSKVESGINIELSKSGKINSKNVTNGEDIGGNEETCGKSCCPAGGKKMVKTSRTKYMPISESNCLGPTLDDAIVQLINCFYTLFQKLGIAKENKTDASDSECNEENNDNETKKSKDADQNDPVDIVQWLHDEYVCLANDIENTNANPGLNNCPCKGANDTSFLQSRRYVLDRLAELLEKKQEMENNKRKKKIL